MLCILGNNLIFAGKKKATRRVAFLKVYDKYDWSCILEK
jgi:hypothetical protein